jgi:adenylate kinase family enzyme
MINSRRNIPEREPPLESRPVLVSLLDELSNRGIGYCLLRDGEQPDRLTDGGEVDLLVERHQWPSFEKLAAGLGFCEVPAWGYRPHRFFFTYDESRDSWHKLDVVTEITYGSPIRALRTDLASRCLRNRQRRGTVYLAQPEDELITLLLHCLLDKRAFKGHRAERLQQLLSDVSDLAHLEQLVSQFWPAPLTWNDLCSYIETGDWDQLLTWRRAVATQLAARDRIGTLVRTMTGFLLQRLNRWRGLLRPRPPMVALMAPDGAGKSTLAAGLQQRFIFPVRHLYMGLYQRQSAPSFLSRLPMGLRLAGRVLGQWWRYTKARYHQVRRRWVIFDRYSYDALMESRAKTGRLSRVRRWFLGHALPQPDLIIVLDAPAEVLHQRKSEHEINTLERQRQFYLGLSRQKANVAVVDASVDTGAVRRTVTALMWRTFCGQPGGALAAREIEHGEAAGNDP